MRKVKFCRPKANFHSCKYWIKIEPFGHTAANWFIMCCKEPYGHTAANWFIMCCKEEAMRFFEELSFRVKLFHISKYCWNLPFRSRSHRIFKIDQLKISKFSFVGKRTNSPIKKEKAVWPCWWSGEQCARLLIRRSDFDSRLFTIFNFGNFVWNLNRTKINERRPVMAHLKNYTLCSAPFNPYRESFQFYYFYLPRTDVFGSFLINCQIQIKEFFIF